MMGRYRPKNGFLQRSFLGSVAGYLVVFLPLLLAAPRNLTTNPHGKSLRDLGPFPKHPFAPPSKLSLVASISLNTLDFAPSRSGNLDRPDSGNLRYVAYDVLLRTGFRTICSGAGKNRQR